MGFLPPDSWDHAVSFVYTVLAAASSIQGREVGRYIHIRGTNSYAFPSGYILRSMYSKLPVPVRPVHAEIQNSAGTKDNNPTETRLSK